jgi:hypothetical protein
MLVRLTAHEIYTLLESIRYSKQRISDTQGTPRSVRKENLAVR